MSFICVTLVVTDTRNAKQQLLLSISPGEERSDAAAWIQLKWLGKFKNELHDYCLMGNMVHQVMFLQQHTALLQMTSHRRFYTENVIA